MLMSKQRLNEISDSKLLAKLEDELHFPVHLHVKDAVDSLIQSEMHYREVFAKQNNDIKQMAKKLNEQLPEDHPMKKLLKKRMDETSLDERIADSTTLFFAKISTFAQWRIAVGMVGVIGCSVSIFRAAKM
jgi:hypothetical protein